MPPSIGKPADTRIMGIVHDALRRDLQRVSDALAAEPFPGDLQRAAIAAHVQWLMDFLHAHHIGEDQGLWPLVREHNPAAGDMLDQMDADHARVGPHIDRVSDAGARYGADPSLPAREGLAEAIKALRSDLDPHLRREEDEMMPIVSATITDAQFKAYENVNHVTAKSKKELGREGHWLIDSLERERFDVVVNTVPAVPRFILLHALARPYRRECATRWGPHVQVAPLSRQHPGTAEDADQIGGWYRVRGEVSVDIEASPRDVYDIVADVTRIGERSPECRTATWLPGPPPQTVGARFRGQNRKGLIRWSRVCEVVTADPGRQFAYRTVPERVDLSRRDSTTWSYQFAVGSTATKVTHSYDVTMLPLRPFMAFYRRAVPQHADMRPAMQHNLDALKHIAEGK
ncbi:MAG TPA: hemerythrin domain-containing protein [Streptosporangiaceae bacterium]|nr:hemerythrin domain-containing protein [Streptosporangiaceae bacterium]